MEWIFHLDTDELLHPAGTRGYSVTELLMDVPADVDMIVFSNYVRKTTSFHYVVCFLMTFMFVCLV